VFFDSKLIFLITIADQLTSRHWHPQVKLSGRGLAGLPPAHQLVWVWTQNLFSGPRQTWVYHWAFTPRADSKFWGSLIWFCLSFSISWNLYTNMRVWLWFFLTQNVLAQYSKLCDLVHYNVQYVDVHSLVTFKMEKHIIYNHNASPSGAIFFFPYQIMACILLLWSKQDPGISICERRLFVYFVCRSEFSLCLLLSAW
jgi:hypothetical protein